MKKFEKQFLQIFSEIEILLEILKNHEKKHLLFILLIENLYSKIILGIKKLLQNFKKNQKYIHLFFEKQQQFFDIHI
jgi:hypothetical protein